MCPTSDGIEDTEHFLLLCPSFDVQRQDLLAEIARLLQPVIQIADLSNDALIQLLLYGDHDLSNNLNRSILELTSRFIHETGRILFRCKFFSTSVVRHFIYHNQLRLRHHSSYHIPGLASGVEQNLVHCH